MNHNAHKCNRFNGCCLANGRMKIDASEPALYYNMIKSYRAARLECTTSAIDTHITLVLRSDWIKLLLLLLFLRLANYSTAGANICRNTSAHGGYYDWNKTTVHAAETTTIANCMDRPFVIIYDAAAECTSDLLFFFPAFSFQHTFWLQGHIQFMLTVSSSLLSNAMSASWALCSYASVGLSSVKKLASSIKHMCVSVIHDPWSMCHVLLWVGGFAPNECYVTHRKPSVLLIAHTEWQSPWMFANETESWPSCVRSVYVCTNSRSVLFNATFSMLCTVLLLSAVCFDII